MPTLRILEIQEQAKLTREEFTQVLQALDGRGYSGLLRTTAIALKKASKSALGPEEILEYPGGAPRLGLPEGGLIELFPREEGTLYLLQPHSEEEVSYERVFRTGRIFQVPTTLQAGFVYEPPASDSVLPEFATCVNETIQAGVDGRRLRGMTLEWKPLAPIGRSIKGLVAPRTEGGTPPQYQKPDYTPEEAELAKLLAQAEARSTLLEVLEAGKARLADVAEQSEGGEGRSGIVAKLARANLLRKEYLVVCQKTSRALTHLASLDELRTGATGQLPCAECGRKFAEERTEEILMPTGTARHLTQGSRWMQIWVTAALEQLGIPRTDIVWNLTRAAEDIDVIAAVQGTLIFFELKDREFGLGDAYPFNYRVSRYGGEIGVVLTTDKVAQDAKAFFEEQSRSRRRGDVVHDVYTIEGLETADKVLKRIVTSVISAYLERRFESPGVRLRLSRLTMRKAG